MRYSYKARQVEDNQIIKGEGEFDNKNELKRYLATQKMVPISIKACSTEGKKKESKGILKQGIKTIDLVMITRQLAVLIEAGISIGQAIAMSSKDCRNKNLKTKLEKVYSKVSRGRSLSQAIQEVGIFPAIIVSMIQAAELAGNIDDTFNQIASYLENQMAIKNKVKKAMIYPGIILCTLIGAVILLITCIIPSYYEFFMQMEIDLPISTRMIMGLGEGMKKYGILGVVIVLVSILIGNQLIKQGRGKYYKDLILLNIPMVGSVYKQLLTARWSECVGMLLRAGIPILQALEMSKKVLNNRIAEIEIDDMVVEIREGKSLQEVLKKSTIYPQLLGSMVGAGEASGRLDDMLEKVGKYFNDRLKETIDKLIIMIEPTLTIAVGGIVGFIMISILAPTVTLASNIL